LFKKMKKMCWVCSLGILGEGTRGGGIDRRERKEGSWERESMNV
jgi:hypothetical protein